MPALISRSGAATDAAILDAIRREPDTTRIAIARALGVTPATVTNSVKRLLADGLVVESGRARSTGGKPASLLRVSTTSRWAIGCTVESDRIALVAMGIGGALRGRVMMPLRPAARAEEILDELERALRSLGALERTERAAFRGIGLADLRPGSEGISALITHLEELTDRPVVRGTPAVCAGLGSEWVGEQPGGEPWLTVHLGPTVGIALLIDGRPLLPWGGASGELAVDGGGIAADVDRALAAGRAGPIHRAAAGQRVVTAHARLTEAAAPGGAPRPPPGPGGPPAGLASRIHLDAAEQRVITAHARLTEAAAHGDSDATTIVTEGATCIARAVAGLIAPLGVRRVMVSGTSVAMAPRLYLEAMTAVLPDETRLRVSTVQPHPCAVGAAALALAHQD